MPEFMEPGDPETGPSPNAQGWDGDLNLATKTQVPEPFVPVTSPQLTCQVFRIQEGT